METKILTTLNEEVKKGVKAIHSIKNGNTSFDNLRIIGRAELAEELLEKMTGEKITLLQDTRDSYDNYGRQLAN
tara:strand:- start:4310 stop:4531 length:222 start_codon:yes stop_codon:yes gene_type:complete